MILNENLLKLDTARVFSSEYSALSSVRPIKLKSMIPFPGCSNRQASDTGFEVVTAVVAAVVPRRYSSPKLKVTLNL